MTYRDLWLGAGLAVLSALLYLVVIPAGITIPSGVRSPVMSPAFWPNIIALFLLAMSALLFVRAAIAWNRGEIVPHKSADVDEEEKQAGWNGQIRAIAVIAIMFIYYWLIIKIGLVPASMVTLLAVGLTAARPKIWLLIIATPVLPMLLYLFFYKVANVPIPGGEWLMFP
ncbi:tripartite tricarboxylate transporter TctB family protein [Dichotomicrobium thermohalophilum]|uniref:Tripartite tricarboxylate transporter TctB family protein n=1 Tax=Dichotomicrobium thermohalophilum TaxID=933063 RepID=A0A397P723_9HYPH|nr:tripartite tricarboxylate transporter TctB family protein [Dichotomicrobium thermohalophilum]RIA45366.1 tripartite tricarboxylate transporter TctB family protein [Dichotomicrobium thermohalophilum]